MSITYVCPTATGADDQVETIVREKRDQQLHDRRIYFRLKSIADRLSAVCLLIPGLPLMGALVLLVRLNSRGPGIFRQVRVGRNGKPFVMYKLRTMTADAEKGSGPTWSQNGDMRITSVGKWLRHFHLDEIPQLFNVIRGQMSLVGPRPERPEFVVLLARNVEGYADRLAAKPGITGLAQMNLPADTDFNSVRRKLYLDVEYIRTASAWLELRILACTGLKMIGLGGDRTIKNLGVARELPKRLWADDEDAKSLADVAPVSNVLIQSTNGNGSVNGNGHSHSSSEVKDSGGEVAVSQPKPSGTVTLSGLMSESDTSESDRATVVVEAAKETVVNQPVDGPTGSSDDLVLTRRAAK